MTSLFSKSFKQVLLFITVSVTLIAALPAAASVEVVAPIPLSDFRLTDQYETPVSLSDLQGRPVVLSFGYTGSPAITDTLETFLMVKHELGADAENVSFVLVSVDGERDTPFMMERLLGFIDPTIIGLSGDAATLAAIAPEYGLEIEEVMIDGDLFLEYTTDTYIINAAGELVKVYDQTAETTEIVESLNELF
jgi:protein SCO1